MDSKDLIQITTAVEKVLDIKLEPIHQELNLVKDGLASIDNRVGKVENRLERVENRLSSLENRFEVLEEKHDILHKEVGKIYAKVEHHSKQLKTS